MSAEVTQLAAEAAKTDVLGTLGINWKLFMAQLVNVGIVIFVLSKWVFKPLVKLMDDRVKKIDDGLAHAKEAVRLEVAELVMRATHKVAATAADDAMQRRYVEQALQELEQTKV